MIVRTLDPIAPYRSLPCLMMRLAGVAVVLLGLFVLMGRYAHWTGMRNYALTDEAAGLERYKRGAKHAPEELLALRALTRDNASQMPRLDKLDSDITAISSNAIELLNAHSAAAVELVRSGSAEGQALMQRAATDLHGFTAEERRLLVVRNANVHDTFLHTLYFLVLRSVLAAVLLVLAHVLATVEMRRRRRTEEKLRASPHCRPLF
jgi:CHASE3 domain sensor protein